MAQVVWVYWLLPQVCSDLSVFHRITYPERMDGLHFLRLAEMLPAYGGAVAAGFRMVLAKTEQQQKDGLRPIDPNMPIDATKHPAAAELFG